MSFPMLKNACWLQKNTFPFQNLHAEKIKSLLFEKKNFLIIMQIYVAWNLLAIGMVGAEVI